MNPYSHSDRYIAIKALSSKIDWLYCMLAIADRKDDQPRVERVMNLIEQSEAELNRLKKQT